MPSANLTVTTHDKLLDASLDAAIEVSGVRANVVAEAELRNDGLLRHGALEVHGLSLTALAANSPAFSALAPFGLTMDLTANVDLDENGKVRSLDFGASGGGVVGRPKIDPIVIGIGNFRMLGRFDGVTKRMLLDEFSIDGSALKAKATGSLDIGWEAGTLTSVTGELDVQNCAFNLPDHFTAPVIFDRMALHGAYDRAAGKVTINNAVLSAGKLQANLSGTAIFDGELSPAIEAKGTVNPIAVRDFLRYWPAGLAEGARIWVDANVSQGGLGQMSLEAHIPAGALDQDVLPDNAVALSFSFAGLAVQYVKGLTLLTGASGSGRLTGDTFRAEVTRGSVGPLAVSAGGVVIPDLHLPQTSGTITAHVQGKIPDILMLIDEPPLGYAKRFHINPKATGGEAALDLNFTVPMLKDLTVDRIGIGIQAKTSGLSLPLGELRRIDNANLAFTIDGKTLVAQGQVQVNTVPLEFKWTEEFANSAITTRVDVSGTLDEVARSKLGLPDAGLVFGPSQMSMSLAGHRAQFASATVRADMHETEISVPTINLEKPVGQAASLAARINFGDKGAIAVQNFILESNAIDVRGDFGIDAQGGLIDASLSVVRVGANDDFSVRAKQVSGSLDVRIEGRSFDASRIFSNNTKPGTKLAKVAQQVLAQEDTALKDPLTMNLKFDRVVLKGGVVFTPFAMNVAFGANARLQNFVLNAGLPNKESITGKFAAQADGAREVMLESSDAGSVFRGVTGFVSMRKGTLSAHATFPAAGTDPATDYKGSLVLSNFNLVDQPFLARLFSVGSLLGPLGLLQGRGISFDKLEIPFSSRGKLVTISDGRGSGSAVGLSIEGTIDRRRNIVDLRGTLVPVYGLNSILGAVPILGDVLVSKKGEGILGVTYAVRGDLDQPQLLVNPLSMLTPGIFRRIFEFGLPNSAKAPTPMASTGGHRNRKISRRPTPPRNPPCRLRRPSKSRRFPFPCRNRDPKPPRRIRVRHTGLTECVSCGRWRA